MGTPACLRYAADLLRIVFLTDRSPAEALPAAVSVPFEIKAERLNEDGVGELRALGPSAIFVDCVADPEGAHALLAAFAGIRQVAPVVAVIDEAGLDRVAWERV